MLSDINWISVGFSVLGAVVTTLVAGAGMLIAWGRMKNEVQNHEKRLNYSNGQIAKQDQKDSNLEAELRAMKSRHESRDSLWRRNNEDHIEIFARINSLEKGQAALPGQMAEMIDKKFKQWREDIKTDIKATIYEIDKEKERKR